MIKRIDELKRYYVELTEPVYAITSIHMWAASEQEVRERLAWEMNRGTYKDFVMDCNRKRF